MEEAEEAEDEVEAAALRGRDVVNVDVDDDEDEDEETVDDGSKPPLPFSAALENAERGASGRRSTAPDGPSTSGS